MYVTRPRSLLKRDPDALSRPPEGPNLGFLVLQDEEAESYCCFGLWKKGINNLPFPQNRNLTVSYTVNTGNGVIVLRDGAMFIPVLNQPLSSNLYYVIPKRWIKVFSVGNGGKSNKVFVNVVMKTQVAGLGDGREAVWEEGKFGEEYEMWFKSVERGERKVGLSMAIVERMIWEEERADWVGKNEKKQVSFERVENFDGKSSEWESCEFYVMVKVVLRRMEGNVVLTYDFRHTNHVQSKWK